VTESTPLVKCVARLNCSKCDEVISEEISGLILLPVIAGTDYHISVQVFRPDTNTILEDDSIVRTISVPRPSPQPNPTQQPQPGPTQHPGSCKFLTF